MPASRIEVHGLRELRRALKEAEGRSPKEIQQANKHAAEIVAGTARVLAPKGKHQGGGNIQPAWASIKAQATSGRGIIAFGGMRAPHEPVVNFGGVIPRRTATAEQKTAFATARAQKKSQAKVARATGAHVTKVRRREHIYKAIELRTPQVLDSYDQALKRITRNL
jgi:hypothetical protein